MNHRSLKPIPLILGSAMLLGGVAVQASTFQVIDLATGYQMAAVGEGKCGEGKCGEGKCGEGKAAMMHDANKDGKLSVEEHQKHAAERFAKADADWLAGPLEERYLSRGERHWKNDQARGAAF